MFLVKMVNNGASGACDACKQRRKKCDETRPSCLRCSRARRNCPGYKLNKDLKFINYTGETGSNLLHQRPAVGIDHCLLDWPCIEQDACLAFFDEYCIISSNRSLSRGYLHGLQTMIAKTGPNSELAQACTIIALSNLGKKLGNIMYMNRAQGLFSSLLRSFRLSISNEAIFTTVESLITAALLGLYEVITGTDAYPGALVAHARGVSAILVSKFSPFDLICGGNLFQVTSPILLEDLAAENPESTSLLYSPATMDKTSERFSVLCTPLFSQSSSTIDVIYSQTEPLIRRAKSLLESEATLDQLRQLKLEAEQLKEAYDAWPETIPQEWTPRVVGVIASKDGGVTPDIGYWPGAISSYYDPYVASIWNSYRKACLLVLNIIISCHHRINTYPEGSGIQIRMHKDVAELTEGIVSSIPYLLAADLEAFVENATAGSPPLVPGRPIGGLLSIHALYVLLTLPVAEPKLKAYIRDCLAWIGTHMGIGLATILSKYTRLDQFDCATEARVIIWTAEGHASQLASQHALYCAYRPNGQAKEAVEMLEQVIKVEETTLGENHPDQLVS